MSKLCLILVCFLAYFPVTAQSEKTGQKLSTRIRDLRAEAKKLKPSQKNIYLNTLREIDSAEKEFSINKNAANFYFYLARAQVFYIEKRDLLPAGDLKTDFASMMQNYDDTAELLKFLDTRIQNGKISNQTEQETEKLGEIRKRYTDLAIISTDESLFNPDTIVKIYFSAVKLKIRMRSFFK